MELIGDSPAFLAQILIVVPIHAAGCIWADHLDAIVLIDYVGRATCTVVEYQYGIVLDFSGAKATLYFRGVLRAFVHFGGGLESSPLEAILRRQGGRTQEEERTEEASSYLST